MKRGETVTRSDKSDGRKKKTNNTKMQITFQCHCCLHDSEEEKQELLEKKSNQL